jgi:hypothetical protein
MRLEMSLQRFDRVLPQECENGEREHPSALTKLAEA